jgi:hypothetical protein
VVAGSTCTLVSLPHVVTERIISVLSYCEIQSLLSTLFIYSPYLLHHVQSKVHLHRKQPQSSSSRAFPLRRCTGTPCSSTHLQSHHTQCHTSASILSSAGAITVAGSQGSNRQGRHLRASSTFHEGNTRNATMWILESKRTDSGATGCRPKQVRGFQCA